MSDEMYKEAVQALRNGQRLRALREGGLPLVRASARTLRKDR